MKKSFDQNRCPADYDVFTFSLPTPYPGDVMLEKSSVFAVDALTSQGTPAAGFGMTYP